MLVEVLGLFQKNFTLRGAVTTSSDLTKINACNRPHNRILGYTAVLRWKTILIRVTHVPVIVQLEYIRFHFFPSIVTYTFFTARGKMELNWLRNNRFETRSSNVSKKKTSTVLTCWESKKYRGALLVWKLLTWDVYLFRVILFWNNPNSYHNFCIEQPPL